MKRLSSSFAICLLLLSSTSTYASLVIVEFEGNVSRIEGVEESALFSNVGVGDSVIGRFTYESDPDFYGGDAAPSSDGSEYVKSPAGSSIGLSFVEFPTDPTLGSSLTQDVDRDASISISNDSSFDIDDLFLLLGSTHIDRLPYSISFLDQTAAVFSSDELPSRLELRDFDVASLGFRFQPISGTTGVYVSLTRLTTIPEPSTLFLLGVAGTLIYGYQSPGRQES